MSGLDGGPGWGRRCAAGSRRSHSNSFIHMSVVRGSILVACQRQFTDRGQTRPSVAPALHRVYTYYGPVRMIGGFPVCGQNRYLERKAAGQSTRYHGAPFRSASLAPAIETARRQPPPRAVPASVLDVSEDADGASLNEGGPLVTTPSTTSRGLLGQRTAHPPTLASDGRAPAGLFTRRRTHLTRTTIFRAVPGSCPQPPGMCGSQRP